MDTFNDKLEKLIKTLTSFKSKMQPNAFVPAIKQVEPVKPPPLNLRPAPIKLPGVAPQTNKDPKMVAAQLKNPKAKKPKMEILKTDKNGQWKLLEKSINDILEKGYVRRAGSRGETHVPMKVSCHHCGKEHKFNANIKDYYNWAENREDINAIDSYLDKDSRAMAKDGMCLPCKDKMFAESEKDDSLDKNIETLLDLFKTLKAHLGENPSNFQRLARISAITQLNAQNPKIDWDKMIPQDKEPKKRSKKKRSESKNFKKSLNDHSQLHAWANADQAARKDYQDNYLSKFPGQHYSKAANLYMKDKGTKQGDIFGLSHIYPNAHDYIRSNINSIKNDPKAMQSAFILTQHSDSYPDFQREMLQHFEPGSEHHKLLTDRVAINSGKPQVNNTQNTSGIIKPH